MLTQEEQFKQDIDRERNEEYIKDYDSELKTQYIDDSLTSLSKEELIDFIKEGFEESELLEMLHYDDMIRRMC